MYACVCVCGNTNLWKTVGTFHRPKAIAGHSNVSMIFVRCIILVTYNESQFITTFRGKKYWKDSGRVCRVQGGAKYQLQKSRNKTILRFIGTDSGTWTFCVMSCIFYLAFSLSFGMKVSFLCSGAKEGSMWYLVAFRTSYNLIIRFQNLLPHIFLHLLKNPGKGLNWSVWVLWLPQRDGGWIALETYVSFYCEFTFTLWPSPFSWTQTAKHDSSIILG